MSEDNIILQEYREAFVRYAKDGVIDLDERIKHKFTFQIHRLEDFVGTMKGIIPPNRQSQYFVSLIEKGSGLKSVGPFTFPIKKRMLLIVPKRVMHSSQYWSLKCAGFVLSFNIDFFLQIAFPRQLIVEKKIFKTSVKPFLILTPDQVEKLKGIFEAILAECHATPNPKNEMIAVKTLELIILCDRFYTENQSSDDEYLYNDTMERFNELLEKNFSKKRTVKFYADALHFHPNHLNFLSKKLSGLTAKETINNRVIMEAKYLLTSTSLSIKELAYKLGFEYPEYFYSFFRKHVQLTPVEYRDTFL